MLLNNVMVSSAEHTISNTRKYKEILRNSFFFSGPDRPKMLFSLLINVKIPTIIDIFTSRSRKNFMLS